MIDETKMMRSSRNVFEDLGLPDAATLTVKADLAAQIGLLIEHRGWSQTRAEAELNVDQPSISKMLSGKLRGFSIERLVEVLLRLDRDVLITIKPSDVEGHGRVLVNSPTEAA